MKVKKPVKTALLLILFAVYLNAAVNHLDVVGRSMAHFFGLLSPILIGFLMAFLLSIPVNALEKRIIRPHGKRALRFQKALQRPVSIILSVLMIVGIVGFISYTVIPNLFTSIHTLFTNMPQMIEDLKAAVIPYREQIPDVVTWLEGLTIDWSGIENKIAGFFQNDSSYASQMIDTVVSAAFSVFGQMFSMVFALIIAFTAVSQKERLAEQAKSALYAFSQPARADVIAEYVRKIGRIFSSFISGQVLEAFILGMMVMAGMIIFRFPHVLAISSLVMLMAFVPIVGAWVSAGVGAIMILTSAGVGKALGFILMIIVLQQIEGNLIYPKVMGKRIGLPSLWVLVAITLGSGALGAIGMLIFVPIFAVIYQLLNEVIEKRKAAHLTHDEVKREMISPAETENIETAYNVHPKTHHARKK